MAPLSPSAPGPVPPGFTVRRVLILALIAAAVYVLYALRSVIVPVFFAFLVAYALDPVVDRLEALRVPRGLAAVGVMGALLVGFAAVFIVGIPLFLDELKEMGEELPAQWNALRGRLEPWLWSNLHWHPPKTISEAVNVYGDRLQTQAPALLNALTVALFGTLGYVAVVVGALIVPLLALYLLIDFDAIVQRTRDLVPRRFLPQATELGAEIHDTLGNYVRGQLTTNLVLAALYALGLRLVDLRLAIPIGILTGVLALIPYLGFALGLATAVFVAVLDWHGIGQVVGVCAVMGLVQVLDGLVITPRIVGRSVGLSPLEVILALAAAGALLGFFGVLLAVPLGAITKRVLRHMVRIYMASDFYRAPPAGRTSVASQPSALYPSRP